MTRSLWIMFGVVGAGTLALLLTNSSKKDVQDRRTNPDFGKHRGVAAVYGGPENMPTRMRSNQDTQGGPADYLGYNYRASRPSVYANDQWNNGGGTAESAVDQQMQVRGQTGEGGGPINYGRPPARIPFLFKDNIRYWDSIDEVGGVRQQQQSLHLFHLRPPVITRGYRSISGSLAPIGGGQSTASNARIPAIFVPSAVA